jgi:hypothetical protein
MAAEESRKRSIVKMLTYRAILTALLAIISWIFTGNLGQTTIIRLFSVCLLLSSIIYTKGFGTALTGEENRFNHCVVNAATVVRDTEIIKLFIQNHHSCCGDSRLESQATT